MEQQQNSTTDIGEQFSRRESPDRSCQNRWAAVCAGVTENSGPNGSSMEKGGEAVRRLGTILKFALTNCGSATEGARRGKALAKGSMLCKDQHMKNLQWNTTTQKISTGRYFTFHRLRNLSSGLLHLFIEKVPSLSSRMDCRGAGVLKGRQGGELLFERRGTVDPAKQSLCASRRILSYHFLITHNPLVPDPTLPGELS